MRRAPSPREDDVVADDWHRWTRFRGTLAQLVDGADEVHAFERAEIKPTIDTRPVRVLRGSPDEPGHHLGRGMTWHKPKKGRTK